MARWPGTWNCICDVCGFQFQSDELTKDWRGLMVCKEDFETRHPSDFVRAIPEHIAPPWVRPEPAYQFIFYCSLYDRQGIAGIGTSGCAIVGNTTGFANPTTNIINPDIYFLIDDFGNTYSEDDGDILIL